MLYCIVLYISRPYLFIYIISIVIIGWNTLLALWHEWHLSPQVSACPTRTLSHVRSVRVWSCRTWCSGVTVTWRHCSRCATNWRLRCRARATSRGSIGKQGIGSASSGTSRTRWGNASVFQTRRGSLTCRGRYEKTLANLSIWRDQGTMERVRNSPFFRHQYAVCTPQVDRKCVTMPRSANKRADAK